MSRLDAVICIIQAVHVSLMSLFLDRCDLEMLEPCQFLMIADRMFAVYSTFGWSALKSSSTKTRYKVEKVKPCLFFTFNCIKNLQIRHLETLSFLGIYTNILKLVPAKRSKEKTEKDVKCS